MKFLDHELLRLWRFRLKVRHVLGVILLCVAVFIVGLVIGWWYGAYEYPYRTLPKPPLPPGQTAPACKKHVMGDCLPKPKASNAASITATNQGPDFSNNDPVYSSSAWSAIAAHNAFAVFKVSEGTGFVDQTARSMASLAKARGLTVGGYDFLHVCGDSAVSEAQVFAYHLRADGLTGSRTLPGIGDVEYQAGNCDERLWLLAWIGEVRLLTGRTPMLYTGAWFWQPHLGVFWPSGVLAWISGYGVRYPFMPSGRSQLDLWQFADNGWNGATFGDLSMWRDGAAAFDRYTGTSAPKARPAKVTWWSPDLAKLDHRRHLIDGLQIDERDSVRVWVADRCLNPVRRPACVRIRKEIGLEKQRIDHLASSRGWSAGSPGSFGTRNQILQHALTMRVG